MVTTYIGWLLGCNVFIVQCMQYTELLCTDSTGLHIDRMFTHVR